MSSFFRDPRLLPLAGLALLALTSRRGSTARVPTAWKGDVHHDGSLARLIPPKRQANEERVYVVERGLSVATGKTTWWVYNPSGVIVTHSFNKKIARKAIFDMEIMVIGLEDRPMDFLERDVTAIVYDVSPRRSAPDRRVPDAGQQISEVWRFPNDTELSLLKRKAARLERKP